MEFILMVVVFAAVLLFLPHILKKPISSERYSKDDISQMDTHSVDNRIEHSPNTESQTQTKLDSLEKQ
jgi:hypothetical protein